MNCYLEFVCTPTADTPGTLVYLHFDDKRYLIGNLSEGSSRAKIQQGLHLKKLSRIFISGRTEWGNVGGLLGMILTLADAHLPSLTLFGPANINYVLATARRFIFRQGMPFEAVECRASDPAFTQDKIVEPTWSDNLIKVWALPVLSDTWSSRPPALDPNLSKYKDLVSKMFNSDWAFDKLFPRKASEANPGAPTFVRDEVSRRLVRYNGPLGRDAGDKEVFQRNPWPAAAKEVALGDPKSVPEAVSYIICSHSRRGKFLQHKAQELGVQPKTLYKDLTLGNSIVLEDGRTITPEMVMEPPKEGKGFAFLDMPSADFIEPLLSRVEWNQPTITSGITAMIWALGPGLSSDARIQAFQTRFPNVKHIISAPDASPDDFVLSTALKAVGRHHRISPDTFPLLQADQQKQSLTSTFPRDGDDSTYTVTDTSKTLAQRNLRLLIQPEVNFALQGLPAPLTAESLQGILDEEFELLNQPPLPLLEPTISSQKTRWRQELDHPEAEVICLGTGSSLPLPHRNVSSTLVRVPGQGSYLFDAGEGTMGSLRRMFSPEQLDEVLQDLKMIWISHLHADHHLGTVSVIKAWHQAVHNSSESIVEGQQPPQATSPRLGVVSTRHMVAWLTEYSRVEDFGLSQLLLVNTTGGAIEPSTYSRNNDRSLWRDHDPQYLQTALDCLGLESLETTPVQHCLHAQAVTLTTRSGFRISYSGDCRPNKDFADRGANSHVLIHEATFEDSMRSEAFAKKHSTVGEAVAVAVRMKAKLCVLTHFSQRYPGMASIEFAAEKQASEDTNDVAEAAETAAQVVESVDEAVSKAPEDVPASAPEQETTDVPDDADDVDADMPVELPRAPAGSPTLRPSDRPFDAVYQQLIVGGGARQYIEETGMPVIMAFDFLRLRMRDAPELERKQPLLRTLYQRARAQESANDKKDDVSDDEGEAKTGDDKNKAEVKTGDDKSKAKAKAKAKAQKKADKHKQEPAQDAKPADPLPAAVAPEAPTEELQHKQFFSPSTPPLHPVSSTAPAAPPATDGDRQRSRSPTCSEDSSPKSPSKRRSSGSKRERKQGRDTELAKRAKLHYDTHIAPRKE